MPVNDGKPSGKSSDLSGFGPGTVRPLGSFTGIPLARLQVPQGGATKTPAQFGDLIHFQQSAWPSIVVRSATRRRPAFFWRLWSTPKEDFKPSCCKHEVTLADPAQTSRKKGSVCKLCLHGVVSSGKMLHELNDMLSSENEIGSVHELCSLGRALLGKNSGSGKELLSQGNLRLQAAVSGACLSSHVLL